MSAIGLITDIPRSLETALNQRLLLYCGFPDCRAAYQRNLEEAEGMVTYYRSVLADPPRGDVATKLKNLDDALAEVAWRQELAASSAAHGN